MKRAADYASLAEVRAEIDRLDRLLVPLIAWWLDVTLWQALLADLGLMAFFFFYTMGFTWAFDRVFGLPASAA